MSKGHRSSGGFEHDFQKWCCEYWAEGNGYTVEKEALGEGKDVRPDVVLRQKAPWTPKRYFRVYIEVQRKYTIKWIRKKMDQYKNDCFIVIRMDNFENLHRSKAQALIGQLLDRDTRKPPKKRKSASKRLKTPSDGDSIINYKGHRIKKKNKRRIDWLERRKKNARQHV